MTKKQEEENWIDEFEKDFSFIRGGVDLVIGNFMHRDMNVEHDSIINVLEEAKNRLDKIRTLINRVNDSQCDPKILKRIQKMKAL